MGWREGKERAVLRNLGEREGRRWRGRSRVIQRTVCVCVCVCVCGTEAIFITSNKQ